MSPRENSVKVQFPAKADFHPANVVAVRPGEPGEWIAKGAYVLSVDTPSGSRNIVAPADGYLYLHVDLLEDLVPRQLLFEVSGTRVEEQPTTARQSHSEAERGARDDSTASVKSDANPPNSTSSDGGLSTLETLMFLVGLVGGFIVAGAVLSYLGDAPFPDRLPGAAAIVAGFLAVIWALTKVLGLQGVSAGDTPTGMAFAILFLAIPAGLMWTGVRDVEEGAYHMVADHVPHVGLPGIPGLAGLFGSGDSGSPGTIIYNSWEPEELPPVPADTVIMDDLG